VRDGRGAREGGGAGAPGGAPAPFHHPPPPSTAGAKHRDDIYNAFEAIYPVLQEFRKGDAAPHPGGAPRPLPVPGGAGGALGVAPAALPPGAGGR
jgi:hypothetical protein